MFVKNYQNVIDLEVSKLPPYGVSEEKKKEYKQAVEDRLYRCFFNCQSIESVVFTIALDEKQRRFF